MESFVHKERCGVVDRDKINVMYFPTKIKKRMRKT
jgi:hypothetical protein